MASEKHEISFLTVKEVADYLRVNQSTIYRLIRRSAIPAFKIGGDWRFRLESINQWLANANAAAPIEAKLSARWSRTGQRPNAFAPTPFFQILQHSLRVTSEAAIVLARICESLSKTVGPIDQRTEMVQDLQRIADGLNGCQDAWSGIVGLDAGDEIAFRTQSENLLKFVPVAFGVVDRYRHLVSFNTSYSQLFGFSRKHLRTVRLTDLVHPDDLESFTKVNEKLWRGNVASARFVGRRLTSTGDAILIRSIAWPIRATPTGKPQYLAAVIEPLVDKEVSSREFKWTADQLFKRRARHRVR